MTAARGDQSDPLVAASAAMVEAADRIATVARQGGEVHLDRASHLQDALHCVRAAAVAIRFALVEEGDRGRRARAGKPARGLIDAEGI